MEDIHWFQNLSINKENTETKAPKQQQVLASYIQYVSICIVMAIHVYIYNGYKNLSTYLSYTAEFLQAQELSDPLKPLKMVQLHLPGMFACEKLWQINSGHADTHTNVSTLFKIYKYFFKIDPGVYLSNLNHCVIHMDIHWFQHQLHTVCVNMQ